MKEAEETYIRALAGYEKVYNAEYKQPLNIRYNLAVMYKETSMLKETVKHFKLIVEDYTNVLGAEDYKMIEVFNQSEKLRQLIKNFKKKCNSLC